MEKANKSKRVVRDEKQRELKLEDVVSLWNIDDTANGNNNINPVTRC